MHVRGRGGGEGGGRETGGFHFVALVVLRRRVQPKAAAVIDFCCLQLGRE